MFLPSLAPESPPIRQHIIILQFLSPVMLYTNLLMYVLLWSIEKKQSALKCAMMSGEYILQIRPLRVPLSDSIYCGSLVQSC